MTINPTGLYLSECLKTLGADLNHSGLAILQNRRFLDIGQPFLKGVHLGMAYIMSELRSFTANLTLSHAFIPLHN